MSRTGKRIAIIGAGMAGLAAANALKVNGASVTLFDKGRGPGGRMSTRRMTDDAGTERHFDHGAQYFTARDSQFTEQVSQWAKAGAVARWPEAGPEAWVGTPGMNAPVKAMTAEHDVHWAVRIETLTRSAGGWTLTDIDGADYGPFYAVIIAVPAEQVAPLLQPHSAEFAAKADAVQSAPCWTVMLGFADPLPTRTNTVRNVGPIGWAARNNAKPGRAPHENWVVQASPEWSADHLEAEKEAVIAPLCDALATALQLDALPEPVLATAHRWRYAMVPKVAGDADPFLWDEALQIGLCGDWLAGPRIENAWLSGHALGEVIAQSN